MERWHRTRARRRRTALRALSAPTEDLNTSPTLAVPTLLRNPMSILGALAFYPRPRLALVSTCSYWFIPRRSWTVLSSACSIGSRRLWCPDNLRVSWAPVPHLSPAASPVVVLDGHGARLSLASLPSYWPVVSARPKCGQLTRAMGRSHTSGWWRGTERYCAPPQLAPLVPLAAVYLAR